MDNETYAKTLRRLACEIDNAAFSAECQENRSEYDSGRASGLRTAAITLRVAAITVENMMKEENNNA